MAASDTGDSHRRVFVVHGRDLDARQSMFDFLRAIGLMPLEWNQAIRRTGKPSPYIGEILDAAFSYAQAVVILLTPDDEARLRSHFVRESDAVHETDLTPQPRQNVLFEAGMAMGRAEDRTILVQLGDVRPFSDIAGRHIVHMDDSAVRRQELAQRLELAGCEVELSGVEWYSTGTFVVNDESPPEYDNETLTSLVPLLIPQSGEEDEELGFLERLADAEDALPTYVAAIVDLTADIEQLGTIARRGTEEIEASDARGGGSRGRLSAAIRFAQTLEPLTARTEQIVDEQRARARSIEGGMTWLLDRVRSGELDENELAAARGFLESLVQARQSSQRAIAAIQEMTATFDPVGQSARPVRRVLTRLSVAYQQLITIFEQWGEWGDTAEALLRDVQV